MRICPNNLKNGGEGRGTEKMASKKRVQTLLIILNKNSPGLDSVLVDDENFNQLTKIAI